MRAQAASTSSQVPAGKMSAQRSAPFFGALALTLVFILHSLMRQAALTAQPCLASQCPWPRLSPAGAASLQALNWTLPGYAGIVSILALLWASMAVCCAVLVFRHARQGLVRILPYAWLLLAMSTVAALAEPGPLIFAVRALGVVAWFLVLGTFPTGRFSPPLMTRAVVILAAAWTVVLGVGDLLVGPDAGAAELRWMAEGFGYSAAALLLLGCQLYQFAHGTTEVRRQQAILLVVMMPFGALGVLTGVSGADPARFGYGTLAGAVAYQAAGFLSVLLFACIALGIVRHGAYGAVVVFNRVLGGTVAATIAVVMYLATAAAASLFAAGQLPQIWGAIAGTAVLSFTLSRVLRGIDRLVYGDAADPRSLVKELSSVALTATTPAGLLTSQGAVIARRLKFPAVRLTPAGQLPADSGLSDVGTWESHTLEAPDGSAIATMDIALRTGQRHLTARDKRALDAASGPVSAAVNAARFTGLLERAALQRVTAREAERRALRRQLHDEMGPTLANARLRIDAARSDIRRDPEKAENHLQHTATALRELLGQVRHLARDLRPPVLDELGLVPAIRDFASDSGLDVSINSRIQARLPDIVEVAAYRIVVEALSNVRRHAGTASVIIRLFVQHGDLILEVRDSGRGFAAGSTAGVGLLSMRERATELGGSLEVTSVPDATKAVTGTSVHCTLPLTGRFVE